METMPALRQPTLNPSRWPPYHLCDLAECAGRAQHMPGCCVQRCLLSSPSARCRAPLPVRLPSCGAWRPLSEHTARPATGPRLSSMQPGCTVHEPPGHCALKGLKPGKSQLSRLGSDSFPNQSLCCRATTSAAMAAAGMRMATTGSQAEWMMVGEGSKRRFEAACHILRQSLVACRAACSSSSSSRWCFPPLTSRHPLHFPTVSELVFRCQNCICRQLCSLAMHNPG